jgi:hypothetical protein
VFNKYVICASGFTEPIKAEIKQLVESEGATYSGDLVCSSTTHLIVDEPGGAKYEHAKMWKINTVKMSWLRESIAARYCLPEANYRLESDNQTSTPTDQQRHAPKRAREVPEIDLSVIGHVGTTDKRTNTATHQIKCVNETDAADNARATSLTKSNLLSTTTMTSSATTNASMSHTTLEANSSALLAAKAADPTLHNALSNYADIGKELNQIAKIKLTLFDGIGVRLLRLFLFFFCIFSLILY